MAAGEAWRGLSDEKRLPYAKRAEADSKRYKEQLCTIARNSAAAAAAAAEASAPEAPAVVVDAAAAGAVSTADTR